MSLSADCGILLPSLSADYFEEAISASAVISRRGGSCSHLATLLREFGIPGVVLLKNLDLPESFWGTVCTEKKVLTCTF